MPPAKVHHPGLDALRGIAVILVVLYHYVPTFRIGWIGVDLFFVLSGFLITRILLSNREQQGYFKNFYAKRALRIFPLYYLVLILFYAFAPYVFSNKDISSTYRYYVDNQVYYWTFTQNWLFVFKGMPTEPYLSHFWSLAIEEQYYLFWPLLVYVIRNLNALKVVLALFFFLALGLRLHFFASGVLQVDVYYCNLFTRLDALSAGGFLAVWLQGKKRVPAAFHLVSFGLFTIVVVYGSLVSALKNNSAISKTIGYSAYAIFFASCCCLMLNSNYAIAKNKALKFLGKISYGIYVYHLPVLLLTHYFLAERTQTVLGGTFPIPTLLSLLAAAITLFASIVSFYTFELPFLKLKRKFS